MFPVTDSAREVTPDSPLSSAVLRYSLRPSPTADAPGPHETRPFGLRFARSLQPAGRRTVRYCHRLQVAVDHTGRPLIERAGAEEDQGKEWKSKTYSDGDEGQEEDLWDWEEQ